MQTPIRQTPVTRCEALAYYAIAATRRYSILLHPPEDVVASLAAIAANLESGVTGLSTSQAAYRTAVLACIGPRVEVRMVDTMADDVVRGAKRSADGAGKDIAAMVFPDGITPIVKPVGQSEVTALIALEGRIEAAPPRWSDAEVQLGRVRSARIAYESALRERTTAMSHAASRRALRDTAKETFLDIYASSTAAIRALFPRDKALQDLFFEETRAASGNADDAADE